MKHRHKYSVASLDYECVNKSIIYVTTCERKAPINKLSRNEALKTQQVQGFTHTRLTSDLFSRHQPGWYVCVCLFNNICNGFHFYIQSTIPCFDSFISSLTTFLHWPTLQMLLQVATNQFSLYISRRNYSGLSLAWVRGS